ncbi:hypothetical protein ASE03_32595 [Kitasatospora sp. Root187]|nr:hypothetical protein ASE03_32595 [Kitasatospora sp. Root187]
MQTSGADIAGIPLRLTQSVHLFGQLPSTFNDAPSDEAEWQTWLQAAGAVEAAHRSTIAWLRSRMPSYPQLPAPQLTPGTALTTTEYTYRLVWQPGERAAGLQRQDVPPVGRLLQATPAQACTLAESARALAAAFQTSEEWQQLEATRAQLDEEALIALRQARGRLKERLAPEAIDAHEPKLALARHNYRCTVLAEELETLTGPAQHFADAFHRADMLIETAASDVFGQLAIYGLPIQLGKVTNIDLEPGTPRRAHFTPENDLWLETGELVQIDDPLVDDTCLLTGMTINFGFGQEPSRMTAQILPGTRSLWKPSPSG